MSVRQQAKKCKKAAQNELRYHLAEICKLINEKWTPPSSAPPLEALKLIQSYFENNFRWVPEMQQSLAAGIVTHSLDCDTFSALIIEAAKQVGISVSPVLITASSKNNPGHAILAVIDQHGKQVFWDPVLTVKVEGEDPCHEYISVDDVKRRLNKWDSNYITSAQQIRIVSEEEFLKRKW